MKVKTTFSTILTLMCVLMLSFTASAQQSNYHASIPNDHPLPIISNGKWSVDGNGNGLMRTYFGWEASGNQDVTIYVPATGTEATEATHAYVKGGGKWTWQTSTKNTYYNLSWVNKAKAGAYSGDGDEKTWQGVPNGDYFVSAVGTKGGHYEYNYTENRFDSNGTSKAWKTQTVQRYTTAVTPSEVAEGEIVFVEVNPYWVGQKVTDGKKYGSRYEQCYYGIKDVQKLTPYDTPDGKLCVVSRPNLQRFLFMKRRASYYTSTQSDDLFAWYDTWSTLNDENYCWFDFASIDHRSEFDNGAVWFAPHNCGASLERNHYVSLIHEGQEGQQNVGYNKTILFYISDKAGESWKDGSTAKEHSTQYSHLPMLSTYSAQQIEPTPAETSVGSGMYDITVKFKSTFYTMSKAIDQSFTKTLDRHTWTQTAEKMWGDKEQGGVREYYTIYRTNYGVDGTPTKELVGTFPAESFRDTDGDGYLEYIDKNVSGTTENHFPAGTDDTFPGGYYVYYDVVASLYVVDKDGNKAETATAFATADTEQQRAYIPGVNKITLTGDYKSMYVASEFTNMDTEEGWFQGTHEYIVQSETQKKGYNKITNTFIGTTGLDLYCKNGDKVAIYKSTDGGTTYNVIQETETTVLGTTTRITTLVNKTFQEVKDFPVGQGQSAKYKLKWTRTGQGETDMWSNDVPLSFVVNGANQGPSNRQGHPDPSLANVEVVHNEIKFKPAPSNIYHIYKNGKWYDTVTDKDWEGKLDDSGYYTYADNQADKVRINVSSEGYSEQDTNVATNDWYAVSVEDRNNNTFGTEDFNFAYNGANTEMVYKANKVVNQTYWDNDKVTFDFFVTFDKNTDRCNTVDVTGKCYKVELCGFLQGNTTSYGTMTAIVEDGEIDPALDSQIEFHYKKSATLSDLGITANPVTEPYNFKTQLAANQDKVVPKKLFAKFYFTNSESEIEAIASHSMFLAADAEGQDDATAVTKNSDNIPFNAAGEGGHYTAIDDVNTDDTRVSVYPNPATDYITVEGVNGNVALYSATGAQVAGVNGQGTVTIDVSGLSKGVYVLKTGNVIEKILIK